MDESTKCMIREMAYFLHDQKLITDIERNKIINKTNALKWR